VVKPSGFCSIVSSDSGSAVTERGVCYGSNPLPTLLDNHMIGDPPRGEGTFSCIIEYAREVTIYIRAYATNSLGTAYGNQVTCIIPCSGSQVCMFTLDLLSPSNGSFGLSPDVKLAWNMDCTSMNHPEMFYIYLDTNSIPSTIRDSTSYVYGNNSIDVKGLQTATTYYWKVVSKPRFCCEASSSPIWSFKTTSK
jgi:hypothetical protein